MVMEVVDVGLGTIFASRTERQEERTVILCDIAVTHETCRNQQLSCDVLVKSRQCCNPASKRLSYSEKSFFR